MCARECERVSQGARCQRTGPGSGVCPPWRPASGREGAPRHRRGRSAGPSGAGAARGAGPDSGLRAPETPSSAPRRPRPGERSPGREVKLRAVGPGSAPEGRGTDARAGEGAGDLRPGVVRTGSAGVYAGGFWKGAGRGGAARRRGPHWGLSGPERGQGWRCPHRRVRGRSGAGGRRRPSQSGAGPARAGATRLRRGVRATGIREGRLERPPRARCPPYPGAGAGLCGAPPPVPGPEPGAPGGPGRRSTRPRPEPGSCLGPVRPRRIRASPGRKRGRRGAARRWVTGLPLPRERWRTPALVLTPAHLTRAHLPHARASHTHTFHARAWPSSGLCLPRPGPGADPAGGEGGPGQAAARSAESPAETGSRAGGARGAALDQTGAGGARGAGAVLRRFGGDGGAPSRLPCSGGSGSGFWPPEQGPDQGRLLPVTWHPSPGRLGAPVNSTWCLEFQKVLSLSQTSLLLLGPPTLVVSSGVCSRSVSDWTLLERLRMTDLWGSAVVRLAHSQPCWGRLPRSVGDRSKVILATRKGGPGDEVMKWFCFY